MSTVDTDMDALLHRIRIIDEIDKYVLALLPALVAKHTNPFHLAHEVFDTAEILANYRDEFLAGVDMLDDK